VLGNISGGLKAAFEEHSWRKRLSRRTDILLSGECGKCAHWVYCRGGCPYFADLYEGDALQASPFCITIKMLMESSSQINRETICVGK
jgi:radical SAM protein with 4Fe4S-binding SPASM domain